MKALCCLVAVALLIVAAPVTAAEGDPASILPQDTMMVMRLEKDAAQGLLSFISIPPVLLMFEPKMVSPFAYLNEALQLAPGTAEKAAAHLTGVSSAVLPPSQKNADEPAFVFILTFDDARWPQTLLAKLPPEGRIQNAHLAAIGKSIVLSEDAGIIATLVAKRFKTLETSPHYLAARKRAAGSSFWITWDFLATLKSARPSMDPETRRKMDRGMKMLGADHLTYILLTGKSDNKNIAVEVSIGMDDRPNMGIIGLLPMDKTLAGTAPAPVNAAAALALNWGDAPKFFAGIRKQLRAILQAGGPPGAAEQFDANAAQVEAMIGVPLDALFGQLGGGVSAFLLPRNKQGMIAREDWAAVLPLKKSAAFQTALTNVLAMMARDAMPPPPQDVDGLAVQAVPGAPVFFTVTADALVVSGSPANVKRAVELKKVPTKSTAMLRLNGGRLMHSYGKAKDNFLMLNVSLACTAKELKLKAGISGLPNSFPMLAAPAVIAALTLLGSSAEATMEAVTDTLPQ